MAGDVVVTTSGMAAACVRPLTAAAPARTAEAPMKLRREIIDISSSLLVGGCETGYCARHFRSLCSTADYHSRQICTCEPEIAHCVDCGSVDGEFLLRFDKKREHVDLHCPIAQHQLVRDHLA